MTKELWQCTATELANLIASKEASSSEVIDAHLNRIGEVNGHLNAVTRVLEEEARADAAAADAAVMAGDDLGPFHGVPFTIKENIDTANTPTTQGLPIFANRISAVDAPIVERMRHAGGVALARTNLPELGLRVSTNNPLHGLTRNPWHPDLTAGGSSGGEGSAIGSGMSPFGLGNDIGGSVRNPAFCCGIASLKPTHGRIPWFSSFAEDQNIGLPVWMMCTDGPMARSVSDLWAGMAVLNGRDVRDPRSVTVALEGPEAPKRAAVLREVPEVECDPWVLDGINKAVAALEAAGWEVVEAVPPEIEQTGKVWAHLLSSDLIGEVLEQSLEIVKMFMSEGLITSLTNLTNQYSSDDMSSTEVHTEFVRLSRLWSQFFVDYPVLIMPTWTAKPFAHDADIDNPDTDWMRDLLACILPPNILNLPSASVPVGVADGLPQSVQCVSDRWRDDLALSAAEDIETQLGIFTPINPVI